MAWFRRLRRTRRDADVVAAPLPVPVSHTPAAARTERALLMLAAQSAQLHTSITHLEHRVDDLSRSLAARSEQPDVDDVLEARRHTARVAAEVTRLEVNLSARIESLRAEMSGSAGEPATRPLTPLDTGF